MPQTPDPYEIENAPDAAATVVEGNQNSTDTHEGTDLMTNPTAIADALATIIALLNAFNRQKFDQITAGWSLPQRCDYASVLLELQQVEAQKAQAVAAVAEAAHPVTEADRPTGHTGPLEPFTTILADAGQPLREWAIDFDSPDETNVWIRRDDTLDSGRVLVGEPTVNIELESAGTQQLGPDEAEHLAGAIRAAAQAVRARPEETDTSENVPTRALCGTASLGDYLSLTAVLAHDGYLTLILNDELGRTTHNVSFNDALETSRLLAEMSRIGRPNSTRPTLRFVEMHGA